jgi:hypothetical protein
VGEDASWDGDTSAKEEFGKSCGLSGHAGEKSQVTAAVFVLEWWEGDSDFSLGRLEEESCIRKPL